MLVHKFKFIRLHLLNSARCSLAFSQKTKCPTLRTTERNVMCVFHTSLSGFDVKQLRGIQPLKS